MSGDLWRRPITDLAPDVQSGAISPVDLLDVYLDRIAAHDPILKAFVHLNTDAKAAAETAASEIAAGDWRGPLHGMPIAIKDNYGTREMPTRAGSDLPSVDYPLADANAVARLRAAGALLIGKTRMHEFAWGMETPPTTNPWNTGCVPGGSSGGSGAAVAAGLAAAALGSDTGGSIRIPASMCGCVGLKATFGLIGRSGIVPHSWSLDHAGPLASSVADAAMLTAVMAGPDANDPAASSAAAPDWTDALAAGAKDLRVGLCRNHFFEGVTTEVADATEELVRKLAAAGAEIVEFTVPELAYGLGAIFAIELASSTAYHDRRLYAGDIASLSPDVRLLVEMGRFVSGSDYLQAERYRRLLGERFKAAFERVDVVLSPTMPLTGWRVGERTVDIADREESVLAVSWRLTYPWNLLGLPASSVPLGLDSAGLPIGIQIAGKPFDEASVLRASAVVETLCGGPFAKTDPIQPT